MGFSALSSKRHWWINVSVWTNKDLSDMYDLITL